MFAHKAKNMYHIGMIVGVGSIGYMIGKWSTERDPNVRVSEFLRNSKEYLQTLENGLTVSAATALESNVQGWKYPDSVPPAGKAVPSVPATGPDAAPARNRVAEIMKYGFPSFENIRSYENFVLSYDQRNRVANWVLEHLTKESVKRNEEVNRAKCEFFEDTSIHPYFRSTNADYKGSGFDRGHLAAAGNHKFNQTTCEKTFILSNMAPQVGEGFNRNMWNNLEKYVRKLCRKYDNVYVCTGPLYLPRVEKDGKSYVRYQVIGKNTVAVPTHFFKVIVMEAADKSLEMESYVMPNQAIDDSTPLKSFQVPVESIERASGLLLFDKIPKKSLKRINGK